MEEIKVKQEPEISLYHVSLEQNTQFHVHVQIKKELDYDTSQFDKYKTEITSEYNCSDIELEDEQVCFQTIIIYYTITNRSLSFTINLIFRHNKVI